jgi:hypothetical protein
MPGDLAASVVVTGNKKDANIGLAQPGHLRGKEQARVVVLPVAVIQVADEEHKGRLLGNGQIYEVFQGPACCATDLRNRGPFIPLQAPERASDYL